MGAGGKVLWVVNTVERAISLANIIPDAICYHSRFKHADRHRQHERLVDRFKGSGPALAITTQVAELSLDISADLVITDVAPIPALIQRLGRLNRYGISSWGWFYVADVPFSHPYNNDELDEAWEWVSELGHRPLSQSDLFEVWWSLPVRASEEKIPRDSALFDGGFETKPGQVREQEVPMVNIVLPSDVAKIRNRELSIRQASIPMFVPRDDAFEDIVTWEVIEYHRVPPQNMISYNERTGAQWVL
jgi:CRISPR-associated endonuclease/helicase Cas3